MRNPLQIWRQLIRRLTRRGEADSGSTVRETTTSSPRAVRQPDDVPALPSGVEQLLQRVDLLESERDTVRHEIGALRSTLNEAQARQDNAELQINTIETLLRKQVGQINELESERDAARQDAETLRSAVNDALARQETAEIHINTLETRLRELAEEHKAAMQAALLREQHQARRLTVTLTVAGMALVLAVIVSVAGLLDSRRNSGLLSGINQGIRDIQQTMQSYQADVQALTAEPPVLTDSTPGTSSTPVLPQAQDVQPPQPAPQLPQPDFVVSGSLPLSGHSFGSRSDARAFFQENALQPGVSTLPGGVQYRVLIPGSGRTPAATDTVVIEYRAFRPDGTELDNSFRELQPSTLVVSEALPGLREALLQMQVNAQWELYVPPDMVSDGVRKRGRFGFEPLIYTVELLSVVTRQPSPPGE